MLRLTAATSPCSLIVASDARVHVRRPSARLANAFHNSRLRPPWPSKKSRALVVVAFTSESIARRAQLGDRGSAATRFARAPLRSRASRSCPLPRLLLASSTVPAQSMTAHRNAPRRRYPLSRSSNTFNSISTPTDVQVAASDHHRPRTFLLVHGFQQLFAFSPPRSRMSPNLQGLHGPRLRARQTSPPRDLPAFRTSISLAGACCVSRSASTKVVLSIFTAPPRCPNTLPLVYPHTMALAPTREPCGRLSGRKTQCSSSSRSFPADISQRLSRARGREKVAPCTAAWVASRQARRSIHDLAPHAPAETDPNDPLWMAVPVKAESWAQL